MAIIFRIEIIAYRKPQENGGMAPGRKLIVLKNLRVITFQDKLDVRGCRS